MFLNGFLKRKGKVDKERYIFNEYYILLDENENIMVISKDWSDIRDRARQYTYTRGGTEILVCDCYKTEINGNSRYYFYKMSVLGG